MDDHNNPKIKGLTLLELIIGMSILTIGVLGLTGAFLNISKSIGTSKARTIAVNLAQEKIEALKNLSYYRLLVTTYSTTASETGTSGFRYDLGYYQTENLNVGQIAYQRRVYIQKVTENNDWWEDDTGLKLITSYVIWEHGGEYKEVSMTNLRDNPNRQNIDAIFEGTIESAGDLLQNAVVQTLQNQLLMDTTESDGAYDIDVPAGTYDIKTSKRGYFTQILEFTVASGATEVANFDLVKMGSGTMVGLAYVNANILISEINFTHAQSHKLVPFLVS